MMWNFSWSCRYQECAVSKIQEKRGRRNGLDLLCIGIIKVNISRLLIIMYPNNLIILRPFMMSLHIQVAPYLEHCSRNYQQLLHYNPLLRVHEHNVIQCTLHLRSPIWFSLLLHPAYLIFLDYHRGICLCKKEKNVFEVYELYFINIIFNGLLFSNLPFKNYLSNIKLCSNAFWQLRITDE